MANSGESAAASIAGPAAVLGVALIAMAIRLHQGELLERILARRLGQQSWRRAFDHRRSDLPPSSDRSQFGCRRPARPQRGHQVRGRKMLGAGILDEPKLPEAPTCVPCARASVRGVDLFPGSAWANTAGMPCGFPTMSISWYSGRQDQASRPLLPFPRSWSGLAQ